MSDEPVPRQVPPTTPVPPDPITGRDKADPLRDYHKVAETVGLIPSLRIGDNLIQLAIVIVGAVIGAGIGALAVVGSEPGWWFGALIGGVTGLIIATFLSGLVLMVFGWIRALRK